MTRQKAKMGDAWYWLHHHCAALVYLMRAAAEETERKAKYWLREAEANFVGYYQRISRDNVMFIEVATSMARLYRERGDTRQALQFLHEAMDAQPTASSPYALAAIIHKESGNLDQALSVLLRGDEALDGSSAELQYFLGLIYVDLGDLDSAVAHAKRAYDLGYPLPGLASKLRRLGRSLN